MTIGEIPLITNIDRVNVRFSAPIPGGPRYTILGVDGFGIVLGKPVRSSRDLQSALGNEQPSPETIGATIRGSLTLYVFDHRHDATYVLADPFGSGIVFLWKNGTEWAVSSSLRTLEAFLRSTAKPTRRSLLYTALLGLTSNGGITEAPLENIDALPQFSYCVAKDGVIATKEYSGVGNFGEIEQGNKAKYDEHLNEAVDSIKANIASASHADVVSRVSHLTGGMDSRTVLGGILATGNSDKFTFYCGGDRRSQDSLIADSLAHTFQLAISENNGLCQVFTPPTDEERTAWAMWETGGVVAGPANPGLRYSNSLILSGGYGELLRTWYDFGLGNLRAEELTPSGLAEILLGGQASPPGTPPKRPNLVSDALFEYVVEYAKRQYRQLARLDVPRDAILEYAYFSGRNRYYVGEISRTISHYAHRFDPLYCIPTIKMAWSLPRSLRKDGFGQFDLLRRLHEPLALHPFDTPRVADSYKREHPDFALKLTYYETILETPPAKREPALPLSTIQLQPLAHQAISEADRKVSREVGVPLLTAANREFYRNNLKRIIADFDERELSEVFNLDDLRSLLSRPARYRPEMRSLRNLYSALSWFTGSSNFSAG